MLTNILKNVFRVSNYFMQSFWAWLSSLYSRKVFLNLGVLFVPWENLTVLNSFQFCFRKTNFKLNYTWHALSTQRLISCLYKYLSVLWVADPIVNEIFETQECIIIRSSLSSLSCISILRIHIQDVAQDLTYSIAVCFQFPVLQKSTMHKNWPFSLCKWHVCLQDT